MTPRPRIAIVHDFLYTYAGAEKVLEQMLNVFPDADLFSLFDHLPDEKRAFIQHKTVQTTMIQHLPGSNKNHRRFLPLMPLAIEQLDVSGYDLIISSSYVAAKGVLTRPNQLHICYCHSPVRFAWDLQNQYLSEAGMIRGFKSLLARAILHYIRIWDVRSANGVDTFLANSQFVAWRIEKTYRREAKTVYPPVDVDYFSLFEKKQNYYLTVCRLVPYKRVELIVKSFAKMPDKKLYLIGEGPEYEKIKLICPPNVRMLGAQHQESLKAYMSQAKAFVYAAEEDFGIVAVEAQACGTPVIAYGRGGLTESVIDGVTGVFFAEQKTDSLIDAIQRFEAHPNWDYAAVRANAERFSQRIFRETFRRVVEQEFAAYKHGHMYKPDESVLRRVNSKDRPVESLSELRTAGNIHEELQVAPQND